MLPAFADQGGTLLKLPRGTIAAETYFQVRDFLRAKALGPQQLAGQRARIRPLALGHRSTTSFHAGKRQNPKIKVLIDCNLNRIRGYAVDHDRQLPDP